MPCSLELLLNFLSLKQWSTRVELINEVADSMRLTKDINHALCLEILKYLLSRRKVFIEINSFYKNAIR